MTKKSLGRTMMLMLPILLITIVALNIGCIQNDNTPQNQIEPQNPTTPLSQLPLTTRQNQISEFITPRAALDLIEEHKTNTNFVIIDDRPRSLFDEGHIPNATNIPWDPSDFAQRLNKLDRNKIYLVYCRDGCGAISRTMKQLGFKEVYDIEGGITAWMDEGLPIER